MLKNRRFLLIGLLLLGTAGLVLGGLAMLPPGPGVTKSNFDRIEKEMNRSQVEAIFGRPSDSQKFFGGLGGGFIQTETWRSEDGARATVSFTEDRVYATGWRDSTETILDKIRRWLHLP